MPFNNEKNGYVNEIEFVKKLDKNKYRDLDYNLQLFVKELYDEIDVNKEIKCYKNKELQKFDIIVEYNNIKKRISIKKVVKNSVHAEPISEFVHFLIECKMPRNLVIAFLKYHYADGTTNGTGDNSISTTEYKCDHQIELDEINKFINQESVIKKVIEKV